MSTKLIAFTGHIGSGKTESAAMLTNLLLKRGFSVSKTHFAWPLKKMAKEYYDIDKNGPITGKYTDDESGFEKAHNQLMDQLAGDDVQLKEKLMKLITYKMPYTWYLQNNGRRILQWLGTDVVRKLVDKDYWVNKMLDILNSISKNLDYIIIDDLRFSNEALALRDFDNIEHTNKYFIHVSRPMENICKTMNMNLKEYQKMIAFEKEIDDIPDLLPSLKVTNDFGNIKQLYNYWKSFYETFL